MCGTPLQWSNKKKFFLLRFCLNTSQESELTLTLNKILVNGSYHIFEEVNL